MTDEERLSLKAEWFDKFNPGMREAKHFLALTSTKLIPQGAERDLQVYLAGFNSACEAKRAEIKQYESHLSAENERSEEQFGRFIAMHNQFEAERSRSAKLMESLTETVEWLQAGDLLSAFEAAKEAIAKHEADRD